MTAGVLECLFLHASAVAVDGGALLFLGHSTAGKSTIARLLGTAFPVLADDSVFASRGPEGRWRVIDGGFRFGAGGIADWEESVRRRSMGKEGIPLRGCMRIHKALEVRVSPLEPVELARYLMDAAMEIDVQRKFGRSAAGGKPEAHAVGAVRMIRKQWFGQVAAIARDCPGWHLWFSRDSELHKLREIITSLAEMPQP